MFECLSGQAAMCPLSTAEATESTQARAHSPISCLSTVLALLRPQTHLLPVSGQERQCQCEEAPSRGPLRRVRRADGSE